MLMTITGTLRQLGQNGPILDQSGIKSRQLASVTHDTDSPEETRTNETGRSPGAILGGPGPMGRADCAKILLEFLAGECAGITNRKHRTEYSADAAAANRDSRRIAS
jgi:hypothetical protein